MILDWTTITLIILSLIFVLIITESDDDEDGSDGGLMQPVYNPWQVVDLIITNEYD